MIFFCCWLRDCLYWCIYFTSWSHCEYLIFNKCDTCCEIAVWFILSVLHIIRNDVVFHFIIIWRIYVVLYITCTMNTPRNFTNITMCAYTHLSMFTRSEGLHFLMANGTLLYRIAAAFSITIYHATGIYVIFPDLHLDHRVVEQRITSIYPSYMYTRILSFNLYITEAQYRWNLYTLQTCHQYTGCWSIL